MINFWWCYKRQHKNKIGGSGSGKRNSLFNLISQQPYIDKIYYILKMHMKENINF